jgi:iron complex outermembrane receptor protein
LSLSLGLRDEFYSDAGQGFAPQAHLIFRPTAWATFRTGISKLFRPPNLPDLSETANLSAIFQLPDPKSATGLTSALVWTGGNADLKPESAQNVTAGWSFTPSSVPDLSAAVTYFHTVFTNRIEAVNFAGDAFVNPQDSWLISPNLSAQERAQVCARSRFIGVKEDCLNAEVGALIDVRTRNAATLKTDGIDLATRYKREAPSANLDLRLDAAYVLHYKQADTPLSPIVEWRNTAHYPPVLRLRSTATVERRAFWASVAVNFQSGYNDVDSTPRRPVPSWTTADLTLGYRLFSPDSESGAGMQLTLSGQNIFNSNPPFLINAGQFIGYDQENGNLLGRRTSLQLEINF